MTKDQSTRRPNGEPGVEIRELVKQFGETRALDGLNLLVPAGAVYGILGPNGAGKTTMVRVLATRCCGPLADRPACWATMSYATPTPCDSGSASPGSSPRSTRTSPEPRTWLR